MAEQLITVNSTAEGAALCGSYDRNLDILRKEYQVELILRGCDLKIIGEEDKAAACARAGIPMESITIETVYENNNEGSHFHPLRDSYRIYKVILGSFVKFMGTSILCVAIDQGLAWLLRDVLLLNLGIDHNGLIWASGLLARLVSSVCNYQLNKSLVFKLRGSARTAVWRYVLLCVAVICVSNLCVQLLSAVGMEEGVAKIICDTVLYFLNYSVQNRWVFREEETA